jgi:hypothetical protein
MTVECVASDTYHDIVDVLRDMQRNVVFKSPAAAESAKTLMLVIEIAANEIERLRAGDPWISVHDALPSLDDHGDPFAVLVTMPGGQVTIGSCDHGDGRVRWCCESTDKPTHWKPLPAAAKRET